jgi:hypothetical protein
MIPEQQITQEIKIDQQQKEIEQAPVIKTEENQANWKAFRDQREADRKAKVEAEKRASEKEAETEALKRALEAVVNKPNQNYQMNSSYTEGEEETEEQRIQRHVDAALKRQTEEHKKVAKQKEMEEYPQRILSDFKDFNEVCSSENLDYMDYHYPEVTTPYKYMPEGYEKWAAAYKAVKRFVPNSDSRRDQVKAERNLAKPGSMSSTGTTQGESSLPPARLDEARRAANWARMQKTQGKGGIG